MKFVFPFLLVFSMFVGLFFLGRLATKRPTPEMGCISYCGNGVCEQNNICYRPPCSCYENNSVCPKDCE